MNNAKVKVLGISGSINPGSTASRLLHSLSTLAGDGFQFTICEDLGELPHFNPQLTESTSSEGVLRWRKLWREADAVIICTPEYAFGMPGLLKDALDWLVSTGEAYKKPLGAISYSPSAMGGEHALSTLLLTLTAQNADFDDSTRLKIPFVRKRLTLNGEISDQNLAEELKCLLQNLLAKANNFYGLT